MFPLLFIVLIHGVKLKYSIAQDARAQCIPIGYCFPQFINVNPRIVTPGSGTPSENSTINCPTGYERCFPSQQATQCGKKYSPNLSNADGPTRRGEHPWQVYMMNETQYIGSGMLLSSDLVLTAAHKVYTKINTPELLKIYIGVHNPTGIAIPPASLSSASQIIVHPDFLVDETTNLPVDYKNDLALVRLKTPQLVGYRTDLSLGCLPEESDDFLDKRAFPNCIVGGWGETSFQSQDYGKVHKQVTVPIVSIQTCKESMLRPNVLGVAGTAKFLDEENELCAGGQAEKDACTQDGGAPLMCYDSTKQTFVAAGLVIWGKGCAQPGVYGVYVDLRKYLPWIAEAFTEITAKK